MVALERAGITGFNLNLLECKLTFIKLSANSMLVLISTYWNVNRGFSDLIAIKNGFNLNLLECKYFITILERI